MRHTPGPWRVFVMGSEGCRILPDTGDIKQDAKYIAVVNGRNLQEDTANSALMAAAPDLHELGIETIAFLESVIFHHAEPDLAMTNELWNKWKAAIQKAESR